MITPKDTKYDFLMVGAGLSNAVIAHQLAQSGYRVLVIDKRNAIGGNCHTSEVNGITVHDYGAHIFHTDNEEVWKFANKFDNFVPFQNSPIARAKLPDELKVKMFAKDHAPEYIYLNLPFNMNTFSKIWPEQTPESIRNMFKSTVDCFNPNKHPLPTYENLEEKAIGMVGRVVYDLLVKGYTEKQWGKPCTELPAEGIINRLPVRFNWNNNYFNDKYQGIPEHGYTKWIENMLNDEWHHVDVWLGTDFADVRADLDKLARWVFYSGSIDELFDYKYGRLPYRSLRFSTKVIGNCGDAQGVAVMNYTTDDVPYTRTIEHKYFCPWKPTPTDTTIVTTEYPADMKPGMEPYYPMNDPEAINLYQKYLFETSSCFTMTGRLGLYRYMDMDDCIAESLRKADDFIKFWQGRNINYVGV